MSIRHITAALALLGLAQIAMAAPAIEEAYEVAVSDVTLPANEFGSVILKPCDGCNSVTLRVDGTTRYFYQGQPWPLKEFRAFVIDMRKKDDALATVIYRLENNRVTRIYVTTPDADDRG